MGGKLEQWLSGLDSLLLDLSRQPVGQQILLDSLSLFCVDDLGAGFARIWLIDETKKTLLLKSSQGQYTRLDGSRSRIPLGQGSKIDNVYASGKPHITNDVLNDPAVKDKDWANREGFISFAGYPLAWGGEKLGVLGMYSRESLSEDIMMVLAVFSLTISLVIFTGNQYERNMTKFCEVTGFKPALLERLINVGRA